MPWGFAAAAVAAVASIATGVMSMDASNAQAEALVAQGNAQKTQADYQATVQQQEAVRQQQVAAANEEDYRREQSRLLAQRRAIGGGSGVMQGEGSPLLTAEDMTGEAELQALRIRNGGDVNAIRLNQQADLTRFSGESSAYGDYKRAGAAVLQGQASLVSGIGSAFGIGAKAYGGSS